MNRVMVIMAGGSGERFWPMSRKERPKQLLPLTNDKSMLLNTVERARACVGTGAVLVVAGPTLVDPIRKDIPDLPDENLLVEPEGRNTAPCLALAAAVVMERWGEDAAMGVLTADHLIRDIDTFVANADLAFEQAAERDWLMTLGIRPTEANTGFGYLEVGPSVHEDERGAAHKVLGFREKPDADTAKEYVDSGNFLWNSGMFFWKAATLRDAFAKHQPDLAEGMGAIREAWGSEKQSEVLEKTFAEWPSISIDYAVMEKAENVGAVAGTFDWDDVGTWTALSRIWPLDEDGNLLAGNCVAIDTNNSIVHSKPLGGRDAPLVATLGIEDMIVVATGDAVLVCPRDRQQDIKKLLRKMEDEKRGEHL